MIVEERKRQRIHEEEDQEEEQTAAQHKDVLNFKKKSKSNCLFTQLKFIRWKNQEIHTSPQGQEVTLSSKTSLSPMPSSSSALKHSTNVSKRELSTCSRTYSRKKREALRVLSPALPAPIVDMIIPTSTFIIVPITTSIIFINQSFQKWWSSRSRGSRFCHLWLWRISRFPYFPTHLEAPQRRAWSSSGPARWCSRSLLTCALSTLVKERKRPKQFLFMVNVGLLVCKLQSCLHEPVHCEKALLSWINPLLELEYVLFWGK